MVVSFNDYKNYPETVVEVLRFVGADLSKWKYQPLPAAMKVITFMKGELIFCVQAPCFQVLAFIAVCASLLLG